MNRPRRSAVAGVAATCVVLTIWSSWVLASRYGLTRSALGPMELLLLRFGFAFVLALPLFLWCRRREVAAGRPPVRSRDRWLIGLTAGPAYGLFAYVGVGLTPAAHGASLTAGMLPLFTIGLGAALGTLRLTRTRVLALGLLVASAAAFVIESHDPARPRAWVGDVLLLGAPASWAVFTHAVRRAGVGPLQATSLIGVYGFALFLPVFLVFGHPGRFAEVAPGVLLLQGVFHGWVVVLLALSLYTFAVRRLGPAGTTFGLAVVPGLTAAAAVGLLGERATPLTLVGIGLNAAGLLCVAAAHAAGAGRRGEPALRPGAELPPPTARP